MKREKKVREKHIPTYEEQHNYTFHRFQRYAGVMLWAGILNVASLIIVIIQAATGQGEITFNFCFGVSDFLFRLLALIPYFSAGGEWLYYVSIVLVAMAFSAGMIAIGNFARLGKIKFLWMGLIIYTLDAFFVIPSSIWLGESQLGMWIMIALHLLIIGFQLFAIIQYYKIVDLAIHYNVLKGQEEEKEDERA